MVMSGLRLGVLSGIAALVSALMPNPAIADEDPFWHSSPRLTGNYALVLDTNDNGLLDANDVQVEEYDSALDASRAIELKAAENKHRVYGKEEMHYFLVGNGQVLATTYPLHTMAFRLTDVGTAYIFGVDTNHDELITNLHLHSHDYLATAGDLGTTTQLKEFCEGKARFEADCSPVYMDHGFVQEVKAADQVVIELEGLGNSLSIVQ